MIEDDDNDLSGVDMTTYFAVKQSGGSDEEALRSGKFVYKRDSNKFWPKLVRTLQKFIIGKAGVALGAIGLALLAYFRKELGL